MDEITLNGKSTAEMDIEELINLANIAQDESKFAVQRINKTSKKFYQNILKFMDKYHSKTDTKGKEFMRKVGKRHKAYKHTQTKHYKDIQHWSSILAEVSDQISFRLDAAGKHPESVSIVKVEGAEEYDIEAAMRSIVLGT